MKAMKKDLQTLINNLKSLSKKTEMMQRKLDKLAKTQASGKTQASAKAQVKRKVKAKVKVRPKKKVVALKVAAIKTTKVSASDVVMKIVKDSNKAVGTAVLKEKTGFKDKKIRDIIYRLKKQDKIKSIQKGYYVVI